MEKFIVQDAFVVRGKGPLLAGRYFLRNCHRAQHYNRSFESRGLPEMIRVDNGPEFISRKLDNRCKEHNLTLAFIQPGKPTQNAYVVERLNGSIRTELLNAYIFKTLDEVREKNQQWKYDYNHNRPHKSLGYKTPVELLP